VSQRNWIIVAVVLVIGYFIYRKMTGQKAVPNLGGQVG